MARGQVEAVRRAGAATGGGASQTAKAVVSEMQSRLVREIEEREAEAAIYSAKLYEPDQRQARERPRASTHARARSLSSGPLLSQMPFWSAHFFRYASAASMVLMKIDNLRPVSNPTDMRRAVCWIWCDWRAPAFRRAIGTSRSG